MFGYFLGDIERGLYNSCVYIALNCKLYVKALLHYGTLYAEQSLRERIHAAYMKADPAFVSSSAQLLFMQATESKDWQILTNLTAGGHI